MDSKGLQVSCEQLDSALVRFSDRRSYHRTMGRNERNVCIEDLNKLEQTCRALAHQLTKAVPNSVSVRAPSSSASPSPSRSPPRTPTPRRTLAVLPLSPREASPPSELAMTSVMNTSQPVAQQPAPTAKKDGPETPEPTAPHAKQNPFYKPLPGRHHGVENPEPSPGPPVTPQPISPLPMPVDNTAHSERNQTLTIIARSYGLRVADLRRCNRHLDTYSDHDPLPPDTRVVLKPTNEPKQQVIQDTIRSISRSMGVLPAALVDRNREVLSRYGIDEPLPPDLDLVIPDAETDPVLTPRGRSSRHKKEHENSRYETDDQVSSRTGKQAWSNKPTSRTETESEYSVDTLSKPKQETHRENKSRDTYGSHYTESEKWSSRSGERSTTRRAAKPTVEERNASKTMSPPDDGKALKEEEGSRGAPEPRKEDHDETKFKQDAATNGDKVMMRDGRHTKQDTRRHVSSDDRYFSRYDSRPRDDYSETAAYSPLDSSQSIGRHPQGTAYSEDSTDDYWRRDDRFGSRTKHTLSDRRPDDRFEEERNGYNSSRPRHEDAHSLHRDRYHHSSYPPVRDEQNFSRNNSARYDDQNSNYDSRRPDDRRSYLIDEEDYLDRRPPKSESRYDDDQSSYWEESPSRRSEYDAPPSVPQDRHANYGREAFDYEKRQSIVTVRGETVADVADAVGWCTPDQLYNLNPDLDRFRIHDVLPAGMKLVLPLQRIETKSREPQEATEWVTVEKGWSLREVAYRYNVDEVDVQRLNSVLIGDPHPEEPLRGVKQLKIPYR